MKAVSDKKRAKLPARKRRAIDLGQDSDGYGSCWRCGQWTEVHPHERLKQSQGGDRADCLLCNPCNQWAASGDIPQAVWDGWLITKKLWPVDPALLPSQARNVLGGIVDFPT